MGVLLHLLSLLCYLVHSKPAESTSSRFEALVSSISLRLAAPDFPMTKLLSSILNQMKDEVNDAENVVLMSSFDLLSSEMSSAYAMTLDAVLMVDSSLGNPVNPSRALGALDGMLSQAILFTGTRSGRGNNTVPLACSDEVICSASMNIRGQLLPSYLQVLASEGLPAEAEPPRRIRWCDIDAEMRRKEEASAALNAAKEAREADLARDLKDRIRRGLHVSMDSSLSKPNGEGRISAADDLALSMDTAKDIDARA